MLEELSKIAMQSGNCRLVLSYTGDQKFAAGISDGITTPLVVNGTIPEIEAELAEKLPGYLVTAQREAAERKAKEEAAKHEAEIKAAEAKLKKENAAKRQAEKQAAEANKANQGELSLF
jgi:hypothetical protein